MNLSYETLNMLLNGWMDWIHITSSAQSSDISTQLLLSTLRLWPPVFFESYFLFFNWYLDINMQYASNTLQNSLWQQYVMIKVADLQQNTRASAVATPETCTTSTCKLPSWLTSVNMNLWTTGMARRRYLSEAYLPCLIDIENLLYSTHIHI